MTLTASPTAARRATVVIYSGGMDSFTVLHRALAEGLEVHALSFDYGQRHARELEVAARVCRELGVPHQVVDIRAIHTLIDNSALTDASRELPEGDYAQDNLAATVVPNRNMILLSLAIAKAVNIGAGRVDYGAHGGDHVLYPDCRPEFVEAMQHLAGIANFEAVEIHAPYLRASKAEILAEGLAMRLDYADTWTCYQGGRLACGECGSCRERLAAFAANGVADPIGYMNQHDPRNAERTTAGCRPGCGACCIAPSISSPIPGMPEGKPAGVRCVQLDDANLCKLFGNPNRPAVCARFDYDTELCGSHRDQALALIT